jgi:hypothetical protein
MATLTIEIPDNKKKRISHIIKEEGGEVKKGNQDIDSEEEDVTHGVYFGENIKRALKILRGY